MGRGLGNVLHVRRCERRDSGAGGQRGRRGNGTAGGRGGGWAGVCHQRARRPRVSTAPLAAPETASCKARFVGLVNFSYSRRRGLLAGTFRTVGSTFIL